MGEMVKEVIRRVGKEKRGGKERETAAFWERALRLALFTATTFLLLHDTVRACTGIVMGNHISGTQNFHHSKVASVVRNILTNVYDDDTVYILTLPSTDAPRSTVLTMVRTYCPDKKDMQ